MGEEGEPKGGKLFKKFKNRDPSPSNSEGSNNMPSSENELSESDISGTNSASADSYSSTNNKPAKNSKTLKSGNNLDDEYHRSKKKKKRRGSKSSSLLRKSKKQQNRELTIAERANQGKRGSSIVGKISLLGHGLRPLRLNALKKVDLINTHADDDSEYSEADLAGNKKLTKKKKKKKKKVASYFEQFTRGKKKKKNKNAGENTSDTSLDQLVRSPSQTSIESMEILGIEILDDSLDLWIEEAQTDIGMFQQTPYEFNVFGKDGNRLFYVMPLIGSSDNIRGNGKPQTFSVHTYMGREICAIKYAASGLCRIAENVEIRVDEDVYGTIVEDGKIYHLMDDNFHEVMTIVQTKTKGGGSCSGKPKQIECDVYYLVDDTNSIPVGIIGRNGLNVEDVLMGAPLGFYFKNMEVPSKLKSRKLNHSHKLYLMTLLVGFMVSCKTIRKDYYVIF